MPETESPVLAAQRLVGQAIDESTDRSVAAVEAATVALERSADAIVASGQALSGAASALSGVEALSLRVAALEQGQPGPGPEPETQTVALSEDASTVLLNPERGWMGHGGSYASERTAGRSVMWIATYGIDSPYRLDNAYNRPLNQAELQAIRTDLSRARSAGVKAKVRFGYNGNPNPPNPARDASLAQTLQHIEQVAPIMHEFEDVIALADWGWFGMWAEGHSSNHHTGDNSQGRSNRQQIMQAWLDAVPASRMIGVRYPPHVRELLHAWGEPNDNLPRDRWYDGSRASRLTYLNDCFVSSGNDVGTYPGGDIDRTTFRRIGRYGGGSGETCSRGNPDQSGGQFSTGDRALAEMERVSLSILSEVYSQPIINRWRNTSPEPGGESYYDIITRRLGYRFVMEAVTAPVTAQRGETITITVRIRNDGFSGIFNPRPIDIAFGPHRVRAIEDARPILPIGGETRDVDLTVKVPDLGEGEHPLSIGMPDAHPNITSDVRYAVRFANEGAWSNGLNGLGLSLTVA